MKIAVITDDGKTTSRYFGRTPYYLVLTIEEGKIINSELQDITVAAQSLIDEKLIDSTELLH
jgi:predicted Fe-Mo cluster-binding NifX family protein